MTTVFKTLLMVLCLGSCAGWGEPGKIVYMISPPRSLSVGFTRMIDARGDFTIFHEPSLSAYHRGHEHDFTLDWFNEAACNTYEDVKTMLLQEEGSLFVKEMAFSLDEFLDDEMMRNSNVYFVFLIRHPHSTILSLYSKLDYLFSDFEHAVGFKATYDLYNKIVASGARKPLVLRSEDLASLPEETVKAFCDYVDVPFLPESLSWNSVGKGFDGKAWHEPKSIAMTSHWHDNAFESTGFTPLRTYVTDANGNPTFSEIRTEADLEICLRAYTDSLPYYNFLVSERN